VNICILWKEGNLGKEDTTVKIYAASSWRNSKYPGIVKLLRDAGHEVFDFQNGGAVRFETDSFKPDHYGMFLSTRLALKAFKTDFRAMRWAEACVLILPGGKSSHLEAGWFSGCGKPCFILANRDIEERPELMYALATLITTRAEDLISALSLYESKPVSRVTDDVKQEIGQYQH
jgi:hypothetical protein